ncbi:nickel-dependent lactate racemase [Fontivita pretiosa]|uniref:nickel-dependent lactate racemase n=1 Tax=Fontivita pretiosa TaxID=2989684 RepID=UPI003D1850CF
MKIEIPYGKQRTMPLVVPESMSCQVVYPNDVTAAASETEAIVQALANPHGGRSLAQFLEGCGNALVIVNDATRPTPTARMLACMMDVLRRHNVYYISAVGSHRVPTEQEHRVMFGEAYEQIKDRILLHDCHNDADMVWLGRTSRGTDIRLNKAVAAADRIVIITSVEPHYFAGYTGGRKSIFPGLAAFESITQNHKWALDATSATFALKGNPVHDDMEEIVQRLAKPIFTLQAVLDARHRICAAYAGDYQQAFYAAVEKARQVFAVRIGQRADIVVTVAPYPTDIDLYQAQKAMENARHAVKKGGVLILVAECWDGIGGETFYRLLSSSTDAQAVFAEIQRGYKLGYHKAAKMIELMNNCTVFAVTSIQPAKLEKIFIRPFATVQQAFDAAVAIKGPDASVIVLMDGNLTVPTADG